MEESPNSFQSPEKKFITPRTYEEYISQFRLSENALRGKKILDIGSGLSNFSKKGNEKFADAGTTVIALDPTYSFLGADINEFKENLGVANLETKQLGAGNIENAYEEIKESPLKIAGSHQHLPFAPGTFDLALAHNSILQFKDREITKNALEEVGKVISENGELRILPADIAYDFARNSFYIRTFEGPTPERKEEAKKYGLTFPPDRETFAILQAYEQAGYKIYAANNPPSKATMRMRRLIPIIPTYSLIIRKDNEVPHVEGRGVLYRLSFQNSQDGFHVSSEHVELPEHDPPS